MHARHRAALTASACALALGALASSAQAAFQLNHIGLQCSDALVVQEGDAYTLSCSGDLLLQGQDGQQGNLLADTSITLNATGNLSLLDVLLQAPRIVLNGSKVSVSTGTVLSLLSGGVTDPRLTDPRLKDPGTAAGAGGVLLLNGVDLGAPGAGQVAPGGSTEGGSIVSGGGSLGSNDPKFGDLNLLAAGSTVPEPSGWATMAMGLMALMGLARRRA